MLTTEMLSDMADGNWPDSGFYDTIKAMARELLANQHARQDKPIMYAIIDPDGKPYMSEFCVSPNADDLESEVEGLNHDLAWEDSGGGRYVVASLYTAPPAPAVQNGWISCDERFPEAGNIVLVSSDGYVTVCEAVCSDYTGRYFSSVATGRELTVTHWMPLPAAPQPK